MKTFIRAPLVLSLALALSGFAQTARPRPNIVIILADDMGWGDPGCYNPQSKSPTPNIDRLATQGMRFTDAHSPSSVCTPTRYGLLTGRYAWRTRLKRGVLQGYDPMLIEPGRLTIASMLKGQGYKTGAVGKWHLGFGDAKPVDYAKPLTPGPTTVGFDYFFGIPSSLDFPPYVYVENEAVTEAPSGAIAGSKSQREGGAGFWRGGAIAPSLKHADVLGTLTDKAVAFIERQTKAQPFFLYVPLSAPHTPWLPLNEWHGKSGAGAYGDFVVQTDAMVGRVLQALDQAGLSENTLVIFTSDNGAPCLPEEVKRYGHAANGPRRGEKADAAEDSYNLLPALLHGQQKRPIREALVHHSNDGTFAIRQGDWKLAFGLGSHGFSEPREIKPQAGESQGQLYNLRYDPAEQNNLWLKQPDIVARLTALLEKYQREGRSAPPPMK